MIPLLGRHVLRMVAADGGPCSYKGTPIATWTWRSSMPTAVKPAVHLLLPRPGGTSCNRRTKSPATPGRHFHRRPVWRSIETEVQLPAQGAHQVHIDFTKFGWRSRSTPPVSSSQLHLPSITSRWALFSAETASASAVHTCPGPTRDSTHSGDLIRRAFAKPIPS